MYQVELTLPRLILARDYHEFGAVEQTFQKLNRRLRCAEVSFNGRSYVGVVYAGRKPSRAVLRALAQEQRIVIE